MVHLNKVYICDISVMGIYHIPHHSRLTQLMPFHLRMGSSNELKMLERDDVEQPQRCAVNM